MKIALKIAVLLIGLVTMNWCYERFMLIEFAAEDADQLLQVEKVNRCDIAYTSASSNFSQLPTEVDRRKISQMIESLSEGKTVEAFNIPGSHAGTHKLLLDRLGNDACTKTVIATINLRTFGADWQNSELESPLNKQNVMYGNRPAILNRFLVSLNAYDHKSIEEREAIKQKIWDSEQLPFPAPHNTVTDWCAEEKWGDWKNPKRQLADQFIKQYAFIIDEQNIRVKDLDEIVSICENHGWKLIFHILPENTQKAEELVGDELTSLMNGNANWLKERYSNMGVITLNNLNLLPDSCFTDRDFPTEHYNDAGRMAVAKTIADEL